MGILFVFLLIGALAAWLMAGIKANELGGSSGLKFYFTHILWCLLSIGFLFLTIVVPTLDCSGFLCGLAEILIFFTLGSIVLLVWPLVLIPRIKNKFNGQTLGSRTDDNIIDI